MALVCLYLGVILYKTNKEGKPSYVSFFDLSYFVSYCLSATTIFVEQMYSLEKAKFGH